MYKSKNNSTPGFDATTHVNQTVNEGQYVNNIVLVPIKTVAETNEELEKGIKQTCEVEANTAAHAGATNADHCVDKFKSKAKFEQAKAIKPHRFQVAEKKEQLNRAQREKASTSQEAIYKEEVAKREPEIAHKEEEYDTAGDILLDEGKAADNECNELKGKLSIKGNISRSMKTILSLMVIYATLILGFDSSLMVNLFEELNLPYWMSLFASIFAGILLLSTSHFYGLAVAEQASKYQKGLSLFSGGVLLLVNFLVRWLSEPVLIDAIVPWALICVSFVIANFLSIKFHRLLPEYKLFKDLQKAEAVRSNKKVELNKNRADREKVREDAKVEAKKESRKQWRALKTNIEDAQAELNHAQRVLKSERKECMNYIKTGVKDIKASFKKGMNSMNVPDERFFNRTFTSRRNGNIASLLIALSFLLSSACNDAPTIDSYESIVGIDKSGGQEGTRMPSAKTIREHVESRFLDLDGSYYQFAWTVKVFVIDSNSVNKEVIFSMSEGEPEWKAVRPKRIEETKRELDRLENYLEELLEAPYSGSTNFYTNIQNHLETLAQSSATKKQAILITDGIGTHAVDLYAKYSKSPESIRQEYAELQQLYYQIRPLPSLDRINFKIVYPSEDLLGVEMNYFWKFMLESAHSAQVDVVPTLS